MESIINNVVANLKQEFMDFFSKEPKLSDVEDFAFKELKEAALELMKGYAEELDKALYEDKVGRRKEGMRVQRLRDQRTILTRIGELRYRRNYYALKDGTYGYPADQVLGVDSYRRVSEGVTLRLAKEAMETSYSKASRLITEGAVSKQTVMHAVRRCRPAEEYCRQRKTAVLHIDADEDHVSLQNGRNLNVPMVTAYEGFERIGNGRRERHKCKQAFHYSACRAGEAFWEEVYDELTARYDLEGTKIYLHGDGAAWIKEGQNYLPNCIFVLDSYHKNKAKKKVLAGCRMGEALEEKRMLNDALRYGNRRKLLEAGKRLTELHPGYRGSITEGISYLYKHLDAVHVRYEDPEARNGGATEPHVSHVLSRRLSSPPMGWSLETLKHLVPMLAAKSCELIPSEEKPELPVCVQKAIHHTAALKTAVRKDMSLLPDPDKYVPFEIIKEGHVTSLYRALQGLSR